MQTITVDRQRFGIKTDPRTGTPCVSSIHPYDLEPEQVAARLLNLDRQAHLTRTGGIW